MDMTPKARYNELLRIAKSDTMTASEFDELLSLHKLLFGKQG